MRRKSKDKLIHATDALLEILAIGGLVTVAGLLSQGYTAPKLFKGLGEFSVWRIKKLLRQLKLRQCIEYDKSDEDSPILLTEKGFIRRSKHSLLTRNYGKWDHLWRLLIFDIPETKKKQRDQFRDLLTSVGCFRIQQSVYAYPYDCKKELLVLASNKYVKKHIEVLTVPNLGRYEKEARKHYFDRQKI
ncbi:MAG: CRISPR-associated endonuclease Cas2 [Patescibacteria group bacterium]